jgi:hypothetical protein
MLACADKRLQKRDIVAYILTVYPWYKTNPHFEQAVSSYLTMYFDKIPREPGWSYSLDNPRGVRYPSLQDSRAIREGA